MTVSVAQARAFLKLLLRGTVLRDLLHKIPEKKRRPKFKLKRKRVFVDTLAGGYYETRNVRERVK